jgi:release factor glutamine methyltransferase
VTDTVDEVLRAAAVRLEPVNGSGRLDAALLLEHVTGDERAAFLRAGARPLDAAHAQTFAALVARRAAGVPIAYLTGEAGFYGRTFAVDRRVLVPRPETEHLVEAALADLVGRGVAAPAIAEIGTGSGAIAVSLALALPAAGVFASDISSDALAVARANAARHGVTLRCTFLHGDLGAPLVRFAPFDCIVANLPYVPTAEIAAAPDPVSYEPRLSLDGGRDGVALYRRLLADLPQLVDERTTVFFEAAPTNIGELRAAIAARFPGGAIATGSDYGGRERYLRFTPPWPDAVRISAAPPAADRSKAPGPPG